MDNRVLIRTQTSEYPTDGHHFVSWLHIHPKGIDSPMFYGDTQAEASAKCFKWILEEGVAFRNIEVGYH